MYAIRSYYDIENRGAGIKTNDTNINGQNIETKEVKEANDLVESKQEANNSEKIVTELENDDTNTFDSEFEFWHKESLFILNNSLLDIDVEKIIPGVKESLKNSICSKQNFLDT